MTSADKASEGGFLYLPWIGVLIEVLREHKYAGERQVEFGKCLVHMVALFFYIYMYAFSRCFYPKRLTIHSGYTFFFSILFFDLLFVNSLICSSVHSLSFMNICTFVLILIIQILILTHSQFIPQFKFILNSDIEKAVLSIAQLGLIKK